jgi:hypothetical protein
MEPRREGDEKRFLAQLRAVDPLNAETLAASLELEHRLQEAYNRIAQASDLLHPIVEGRRRPRGGLMTPNCPDGAPQLRAATRSLVCVRRV